MGEPVSAADAELLRRGVREAFSDLNGPEEVRRLMASQQGWSRATWQRLAGELGLAGLMLPAEVGGGGFTAAEAAVVFEEAGAALLCAPLFSTSALAVPLLLACGDADVLAVYGSGIASGDVVATVALAEADGRWDVDAITVRARPDGSGGWLIEGRKSFVVDGSTADLVLVVARAGADFAIFAVDGAAAGIERIPLVTLDQTRKLADLDFAGTPATPVRTQDAVTAVRRAAEVARVCLAAEQAGGAGACLDVAAEYARTRVQFARPIGSFQAVKQRLAEMLVQVESARSAVHAAARACAEERDTVPNASANDLHTSARIAALVCGEAYEWVAAQCIQLHGGIGFTWEHVAHLYYKRARSSRQLLGTSGDHLAALAALIETMPL